MYKDKYRHYLTDEEPDAILLTTGYVIVTPPPGNALMVTPHKLASTPITEVRGSYTRVI